MIRPMLQFGALTAALFISSSDLDAQRRGRVVRAQPAPATEAQADVEYAEIRLDRGGLTIPAGTVSLKQLIDCVAHYTERNIMYDASTLAQVSDPNRL